MAKVLEKKQNEKPENKKWKTKTVSGPSTNYALGFRSAGLWIWTLIYLFMGVLNQIHLKNNKQHSYRVFIFLYYFIRYKSQ